jgi:5,5'-dehydrodivanillate O-demethylase
MPITHEVNERLTHYGPGTPGGELFRRYWHPVAVITELTDELPTKPVRILGEDLVLWKDKSGRVGLVQAHCGHRAASLLYGRVEERGIACAYHGWLYDTVGNCLETPAEPAGSNFHLTVKIAAYPVRPHLGLYWAYLGPEPAPLLPRCGAAETWRVAGIEEQIEIHANWMQVIENNVDGTHFPILHQETGANRWKDARLVNTTRGYIDLYTTLQYWEEPVGLMRRQTYADGGSEEDVLIFPNIKRRTSEVSIKVPVDDTETRQYHLFFDTDPSDHDRPIEHWVRQTHVEVRNGPNGRFRMDEIRFQDLTVMESQGTVSARERWCLGTSDHGIALLHEMLLREMAQVERGLDPKGVYHDPELARAENERAAQLVMSGRFRGHGIRMYPGI